MAAGPALLAAWRRTLPLRWHGLVVPYGQAVGMFVAGYAAATAVYWPWALGGWWGGAVPLAAGAALCWWLWQPWVLLATNAKGESRRLPLMLVWLLCLGLGLSLREGLYAQLGQVRDIASVRELAQPGDAVFFGCTGLFTLPRRCGGTASRLTFAPAGAGPGSFTAPATWPARCWPLPPTQRGTSRPRWRGSATATKSTSAITSRRPSASGGA